MKKDDSSPFSVTVCCFHGCIKPDQSMPQKKLSVWIDAFWHSTLNLYYVYTSLTLLRISYRIINKTACEQVYFSFFDGTYSISKTVSNYFAHNFLNIAPTQILVNPVPIENPP